jgi:hypothetical protein
MEIKNLDLYTLGTWAIRLIKANDALSGKDLVIVDPITGDSVELMRHKLQQLYGHAFEILTVSEASRRELTNLSNIDTTLKIQNSSPTEPFITQSKSGQEYRREKRKQQRRTKFAFNP